MKPSALLLSLFAFFCLKASAQIITTVAGNGSWEISGDSSLATTAGLNYPMAIVFDKMGNIYVSAGHCVRRIDAKTKIITTIAGNGTAGFSGDGGLLQYSQYLLECLW